MNSDAEPNNQTVPSGKDVQEEIDDKNLTINPGDRIDARSPQDKSKQVAADVADITGDHIVVPTYFSVEADGEEKQLHHVKDSEEISDAIRQMRMDEDGNRVWW